MFEHKSNNLVPFSIFIRKVVKYFFYSIVFIGLALLIGVSGYHYYADLDWVDSFYNASMILTGMGPVAERTSIPAKLFSSFYALYSGFAILSTIAILFATATHRILHRFHIENDESK